MLYMRHLRSLSYNYFFNYSNPKTIINMKVACLGNMNNNFFVFLRYLKDRGIDAHLFLNQEASHFLPQADTYDMLPYQDCIHEINWSWETLEKETIIEMLKPYDVFIVCGYFPAFLAKAGIKADIFVPYGADLYQVPFLFSDIEIYIETILHKIFLILKKWFHYRHLPRYKKYLQVMFPQYQRNGIKNAKMIALIEKNPFFEVPLDRIKPKGERTFAAIPVLHLPTYTKENIENHKTNITYYQAFALLREKYELLIFHHARHIWKNPVANNYVKGNDIFFHGLARVIKANPNKKIGLISLEYGTDIQESKQLIKELGIEDNVHWFPILPRKEIMAGLSFADIVVGEFVFSWVIGGVINEAMSMSKPLIMFRDDQLYRHLPQPLYPILNSKTIEEVEKNLTICIQSPALMIEIGSKCYEWHKKHMVDEALEIFDKYIKKN
jgi:hypothetical protein